MLFYEHSIWYLQDSGLASLLTIGKHCFFNVKLSTTSPHIEGAKKADGTALTLCYCRDKRTRTSDHLVPNQVRYQLRHIPINTSASHSRLDTLLQISVIAFNTRQLYRLTFLMRPFSRGLQPIVDVFAGIIGFEPITYWLTANCSTIELYSRFDCPRLFSHY